MESTLSDTHCEDIWEALSDAFIDNEVHYELIARRVAGIPREQRKQIFYTEVAPQCGPNLLTVIPPIWSGFDRRDLAESIREMLERNRHSALARFKHRITVALLRWHFRCIWEELEVELNKKAAAASDSPTPVE